MQQYPLEIAIFNKIVLDREAHARLLNTLSQMELCGAQLISKALPHLPLTIFVLEHISEEYRHAFFLRKLANKLAQKELSSEQTLCLREGLFYLKSLNLSICRLLKEHGLPFKPQALLPYLLTTFVIEMRALPFYQNYQSVIDEHNLALSLKSVIAEEENHLREIKGQLLSLGLSDSFLNLCLKMEEKAFAKWLLALA